MLRRLELVTMNVCTVYKLTVCSFMMGCVSVGLLALAVSTDSWLLTREFFTTPGVGNQSDYKTWFRVWTGLWRFCMVDENNPNEVYCMAVNYDVSSTGRGESGASTTTTIIGAARGAVPLPASALVVSITAVVFTVVGNIRQDVKTLVGGVLFILAGLSLAVGMILYISAINDEVGYRSSTSKHEGGFNYEYGWSFYTAGFGFLASELSAVVTITLFLRRNEKLEDMARIIPGLEDKVAMGRAQDNLVACHCQELGSSGEDACCSLCCREESDIAQQPRPWQGFCGLGGGVCRIGGGACVEGGAGSHCDKGSWGGGGGGTKRSGDIGGGNLGACGFSVGACTRGSVGAVSRDGSDRSVGGEDGGSSSSKTMGKVKRSMSVSA